jgi:SAM-dependent methyltransferase
VKTTASFEQDCLLCGGRRYAEIHRKGAWRYLRCAACGLVQLYPRPNSLQAETYYDDYLSADPQAVRQWGRMVRPVVKRAADLIQEKLTVRSGRLLDVGCGYGFFLGEMARRGWQVQGIEISPTGRRHAREKLGLDVSGQTVESLKWPPQRFDVITLFYVIEHLADPDALLGRVYQWLKPGGLLLLRWPHTTPIVRLLGPLARRFDLYHTPYHLYDFSPRTLTALLRQSGFERIDTCIGGFTLPAHPAARLCSRAFGTLAEGLARYSPGHSLLPGVSKTTLAFKPVLCPGAR